MSPRDADAVTPLEDAVARATSAPPPAQDTARPEGSDTSPAPAQASADETMMDGRVPFELLASSMRSIPPQDAATAPPPHAHEAQAVAERALAEQTMVELAPRNDARDAGEDTAIEQAPDTQPPTPPPTGPPVDRAHADMNQTLAFGSGPPPAAFGVDLNQTLSFGSVPAPLMAATARPTGDALARPIVDDENTMTTAQLSRDDDTVMGVPSALLFGLARAPAAPATPKFEVRDLPPEPPTYAPNAAPVPAGYAAYAPDLTAPPGPEVAPGSEENTVIGAVGTPPVLTRGSVHPGAPTAREEETITSQSAQAMRMVREALRSDAPPGFAPASYRPPPAGATPSSPPPARASNPSYPPPPDPARRTSAYPGARASSPPPRSNADDNTVMGALGADPELARRLEAMNFGRGPESERSSEDVAALFDKLDASELTMGDEQVRRRNSIAVRQRRARFQTYVAWGVLVAALVCLGAATKYIVSRLSAPPKTGSPASK